MYEYEYVDVNVELGEVVYDWLSLPERANDDDSLLIKVGYGDFVGSKGNMPGGRVELELPDIDAL